MTPAIAILLLIFITNGAVGLSVFFTNSKRSQNRLFLIFSTSLSLWVLFVAGIIFSRTTQWAQIGIRGASIAGASIPVTFYLFCKAIASPSLSFWQLCKKSKLVLILSAMVCMMCTTRFFLEAVTMPSPENNLFVPEAHYGTGFTVFMAFFPIVIYRAIYVFYRILRTSEGMMRTEMQFTLVGMASALPIAVLIHAIAIISGSSQPQQYGPLCIIPMNLVIAYGIATRRILGIEKVLRQVMAFALLGSFLALVYIVIWSIAKYALSDFIGDNTLLPQVLATVAALLLLPPAQHHIHAVTNRFMPSSAMDVSNTMKAASSIFQSVSTVNSLTSHFSKLIKTSLQAKSLFILRAGAGGYSQVLPDSPAKRIFLDPEHPLVSMLKMHKDTVSKDSLARSKETPISKLVMSEMDRLGMAMVTGTFSKGSLTGILLLGPKRGRGIYDKAEQDALQILCNQFAVALENAQMYTEMQDSKIRNEMLLDQLVSGVIVADPERGITLINHEAQRITRLNEENTLGHDIDVLPPALAKALEATLNTKSGIQNANSILFLTDEETTHVRMGSAYLLGHDEKPMGALLVFTDMTELKKLEEQVRRADQLSSVGTLAAGMAHEIKNPLVTIKTFTQLLPERHAEDEFRENFSSLVGHEVARIDGIVNQLLSFSKPSQPHLVPMRLHDTVEQTLKLINEQVSQKHIALSNNFRARQDLISGDPDLLTQALVNLNLNAIDAVDSDGAIDVSTSNCTYRFAIGDDPDNAVKKNCIRLQITDTGVGIEQEKLHKIFDPFFTSKSEGTGMGLSVAHGIIQEHHGVIEVDSQLGKGTVFSIYLPLLKEGAA